MSKYFNDYDDYDTAYENDKRNERMELLEDSVAAYKAKAMHEEVLRERYPALQDAWESYQIILKTVS